MKTIIIKHLHLLNFKGVADLAIDFDAHATDIAGRNGTGKTTVFDAFTWLLFGKDSQNRTEFDLKTLDREGRIIYHLPHEVSATIIVDGEEITLCRRLVEKWPKRNGEPTFTGNTIERLFNDVPCNEREFSAKIAEICDEDTFKKITSPTFFVSQKADKQKADLMRMAGEINDAELAAGNAEFQMLIDMLGTGTTKKTIDELKREIGAKKSRVKSEIADIPGRIDEKKRDIARDTDDWEAIETEIDKVTAERDEVDAQLTDINAAVQKAEKSRLELASKLSGLQIALTRRRQEISNEALNEVHNRINQARILDSDIQNEHRVTAQLTQRMQSEQTLLDDLQGRRERLLNDYRDCSARIAMASAETFAPSDDDFICPTCHRPLDVDDIAAKQSELAAQFEQSKARRVAALMGERDANIAQGKRVKAEIEQATARISNLSAEIDKSATRLKALCEKSKASGGIVAPDVEPIIAADAEVKRLTAEIAKLEALQRETKAEAPANQHELRTKRDALNAVLDTFKSRLAKRESIADHNERIAELEEQYRTLNDELNELEHIEYIIAEFSKAKSEAIDARINDMFEIVRFRWIKYRINGEELETCEATINGVPYASLNAAGRIAAGIDIINAICRFEGVTAPIVIDNAESLNAVPKTLSQQIRLIVSTDDRITVKQPNY